MKPKDNVGLVESSDEEEDGSDMEENFVLLTEGTRQREGKPEVEDEGSDEEEEAGDGEESDDEEIEDEEESGDEEIEDEEESGDEETEDEEQSGDEEEVGDGEGSETIENDVNEEDDSESDDDDDDDDDDDNDDDRDEGVDDDERGEGARNLQTREDVKKELSMMSFEDLIALQNEVGTKAFQTVVHGEKKVGRENQPAKKKRLNKHRPMEISSKVPVTFIRQVVPGKKPTSRDPRFDDLSGEYKADIFRKTFKFIDEIRHKEMKVVQKRLKKAKSEEKKEKLDFLLKRMKNQERARENEEQRRERELQFKRLQRERASQGARPFFLKKSDKKKLQLADRYQELKKSGRLENFLNKKRKRNAGKDRRKLPAQQRAAASWQD